MDNLKARAIAFYLPQFHPTPENDLWWGKGFTEWTNVTKAKPMFSKHYQPRLPADLGYYDLRLPEVREMQVQMAQKYGIEGFCYWHYWFGNNKKILERPINEVVASGKPDFPFCLAWANGSWTGIWHGNPKKVLIEQTYPGEKDYTDYFYYLLDAFKDKRYICVDDKPLFCINEPDEIPDILAFTNLFRQLALKNGLKGLYIVANTGREDWNPLAHGCDAVNLVLIGNLYRGIPTSRRLLFQKFKNQVIKKQWLTKTYKKLLKRPVQTYYYEDAIPFLTSKKQFDYDCYPCVLPNWDNSPRSGVNAMIFHHSTPELFEQHLSNALNLVKDKEADKRIIFVKSWNEWAEGNYLEPDSKFGKKYLEVVKKVLTK